MKACLQWVHLDNVQTKMRYLEHHLNVNNCSSPISVHLPSRAQVLCLHARMELNFVTLYSRLVVCCSDFLYFAFIRQGWETNPPQGHTTHPQPVLPQPQFRVPAPPRPNPNQIPVVGASRPGSYVVPQQPQQVQPTSQLPAQTHVIQQQVVQAQVGGASSKDLSNRIL